MKLTRMQLRNLINEFANTYSRDFKIGADGGGNTPPPVEPPRREGGGPSGWGEPDECPDDKSMIIVMRLIEELKYLRDYDDIDILKFFGHKPDRGGWRAMRGTIEDYADQICNGRDVSDLRIELGLDPYGSEI